MFCLLLYHILLVLLSMPIVMRDTGRKSRDTGHGTRDRGHGTRDTGTRGHGDTGTRNTGHGTRDTGHGGALLGGGGSNKRRRTRELCEPSPPRITRAQLRIATRVRAQPAQRFSKHPWLSWKLWLKRRYRLHRLRSRVQEGKSANDTVEPQLEAS